jgi:cell division protein FtsQ
MRADREQIKYVSVLLSLLFIALVLFARLTYLFLADAKRFPIHAIKVVGSYEHVTRHNFEDVLEKYLSYGFFALPIRKLYAELKAFEWAKEVRVQRIWPDKLKIVLIEKKPVAIWHHAYMTEQGEIFGHGQVEHENLYPILKGPINQQVDVLQMYENLSKILSIYRLKASKLYLRENQAWELTLENGVTIRLGKQDLQKRLEHFCRAYPALVSNTTAQLVSADLRYERGMAVRWKDIQENNGKKIGQKSDHRS